MDIAGERHTGIRGEIPFTFALRSAQQIYMSRGASSSATPAGRGTLSALGIVFKGYLHTAEIRRLIRVQVSRDFTRIAVKTLLRRTEEQADEVVERAVALACCRCNSDLPYEHFSVAFLHQYFCLPYINYHLLGESERRDLDGETTWNRKNFPWVYDGAWGDGPLQPCTAGPDPWLDSPPSSPPSSYSD